MAGMRRLRGSPALLGLSALIGISGPTARPGPIAVSDRNGLPGPAGVPGPADVPGPSGVPNVAGMTHATGLPGAGGVVGLVRARGERGVFGVAAWDGAGHAVIMARLRVAVRGWYEACGGHGLGLRPALRKVQPAPGQPPHNVQSGSGRPFGARGAVEAPIGHCARCSQVPGGCAAGGSACLEVSGAVECAYGYGGRVWSHRDGAKWPRPGSGIGRVGQGRLRPGAGPSCRCCLQRCYLRPSRDLRGGADSDRGVGAGAIVIASA